MQGWIKLHRCLMDKPIWLESTPEQKTIMITLLMLANHKGKEWEWKGEKYTAEPGQFVTSLESIVHKSGKGITIQNVRTALKRFEKYEFLTNESTNKNRLLTIVNWGVYQSLDDTPNKQDNKQLTSNQQATNKQLTTNKNVENDNNEKNEKNNNSRLKFETCDLESSQLLFRLMLENNPNAKEPNFESWADEIRKIRLIDKRPTEHINWLINWTQKDSFWSSNILSPSKLRKQWDQLILKAKEEHQKKQRTPNKPKAYQSLQDWADE